MDYEQCGNYAMEQFANLDWEGMGYRKGLLAKITEGLTSDEFNVAYGHAYGRVTFYVGSSLAECMRVVVAEMRKKGEWDEVV